ncbi:MAG: fibronectin type III domain-containing protein, partial [Kiritimatiellae bacterium]|nr:fibronectin type III domain-containing protein [Kiritimatiellia bacterium]
VEYIEFTFSSLLTAGYPTPTYNLTTAVSTNEYGFEQSNGYLLFSPQSYGTFTFKCVASNENGTATNTLTVTVTQAPPAVPANLTLSNIDTASFTASWSAAANADSYRLDVVQGDSFETAIGDPVLETGFSDTSGWTLYGTGTYTGSGYYGQGSPSIKFDGSGDYAISPDFGSGVKLQFWALGNGGAGSTFAISGLVNGSWTDIETVTIAQGGDTYEVALSSGTSQVRFDFAKSVNCALDDVVVYGPGAEAGEYVPGWSNATVNATSATVTGLQPSTTYAVRVRAVNAAGTSANSSVATATTLAGVSAPAWTAFPAQTYRFGSDDGYFNFDVSPYVSGSPAPALSLEDTPLSAVLTEETGEFTFEPDALGTFSFTFVASNSLGVASNTLSVTVDAVAPALAAIGDRTGTLGSDVEFPLSATGDPAPVFDVTSADAADAVVVDQAGTSYFLFTPAATGTYHFTVTATNIAGSDSESFTVTINDAPVTVPTLTVSDVTDTSALASWTACDGVSAYTLQLASDDQFTTGGSGATVTFFSNDGTDATVPTGWSYEIESAGNKSGLVLKNDDYVITESFDASSCTALSLSLEIRTYGGSSGTTDTLLVQYSADNGTSWNNVGTITATGKTLAAADPLDVSVAAGNASVRLRFTDPGASSSQGVGIAYLVLTGTESAAGGSLISTDTVSGLSHAFTGLDPVTTYYARVKGDSDWSSVVSFTTQSTGDSAPVWTAIPSQTVDVGTNCWLNLANYVSGTPAPANTH